MLSITDGAITDPALDERLCSRANAYTTRTVDHTIADDSLREEREGWGGFVGFYCDSGGHRGCCGRNPGWDCKRLDKLRCNGPPCCGNYCTLAHVKKLSDKVCIGSHHIRKDVSIVHISP